MDAACQVCGSERIENYVEHEDGRYLRCRECGLVFNPDAERLAAAATEHYDDATYFSWYAKRFDRKVIAARRRMDIVRSYADGGKLLDIGCGLGETLIAAREAGFDADGLDIGAFPVKHCREQGFEVHEASITETGLPDESVDVITMWDVLEHIPRTADGLAEVARILKPGGVAAMMVPSGEYIKAHLCRRTYQNYQGLWARTHFVYHNQRTLRRVLADAGLRAQRPPVIRMGALRRTWPEALVEALIALPRYAIWNLRVWCRLTRNVFVVARKGP